MLTGRTHVASDFHGMKINGMLRGSAWCARCSRESRGSIVNRPTRFGRQCRTNTWTIHSKNGKSASITNGTTASVNCQSPTMIRAISATTKSDANHPGGGVLPELAPSVGQREPFAVRYAQSWWSSAILQVIEGGEQRRGGGLE